MDSNFVSFILSLASAGFVGTVVIAYKARQEIAQIRAWQDAVVPQLNRLTKNVSDLHEWHDRRDADGVPVWYVRASLEDSINNLVKAIHALTKVSEGQLRKLDMIDTELRKNGS